tara:strand:- start:650 stop:1051 length:402 start_codon:yes stop_codon:yes gene_type:complete
MSRLLENIIKKTSMINFNLTKSYTENLNESRLMNINHESPIEPVAASWKETIRGNKVFLEKIYRFEDTKHIKYFLSEYINSYQKLGYDPEIRIKGKTIKVFLGNDNFTNITDVDLSFSKHLDEIYEDIFYLKG